MLISSWGENKGDRDRVARDDNKKIVRNKQESMLTVHQPVERVLGVPVHLWDDYVGELHDRLRRGVGTHVVTLNSEMTMQALESPPGNGALASAIAEADMVIPDGAGVVFYFWLRGKRVFRCPGIELAEKVLQLAGAAEQKWPVFFYGGAPGVAAAASAIWQQRCPGLVFAGIEHGYLSPEEEPKLLETLKQLQPRIILVGLGVPRQELWIRRHRHLCPQAIWIGVGGSFDIWAGRKTRAPQWLQRLHMEWAYRLYQEPHRWRRMLALPHFAYLSVVTLRNKPGL